MSGSKSFGFQVVSLWENAKTKQFGLLKDELLWLLQLFRRQIKWSWNDEARGKFGSCRHWSVKYEVTLRVVGSGRRSMRELGSCWKSATMLATDRELVNIVGLESKNGRIAPKCSGRVGFDQRLLLKIMMMTMMMLLIMSLLIKEVENADIDDWWWVSIHFFNFFMFFCFFSFLSYMMGFCNFFLLF